VYDGNIMGVPEKNMDKFSLNVANKGIPTGISYMDGVAGNAASKIEEMLATGSEKISIRTTISKSLSDINLKLDKIALNYITGNNKVIDLRGPVFCTITCEIK